MIHPSIFPSGNGRITFALLAATTATALGLVPSSAAQKPEASAPGREHPHHGETGPPQTGPDLPPSHPAPSAHDGDGGHRTPGEPAGPTVGSAGPPPPPPPLGTFPIEGMDAPFVATLTLDQLEGRFGDGGDSFRWEATGWAGGDVHRLWTKLEGEQAARGESAGDIEVQVLYSRLVAPFWEAQVGARFDHRWEGDRRRRRSYAVVGLEGLSPYRFEVEPALFLSDRGRLSARLTASTELLLTQRLIAQPRLEINAAAMGDPAFETGDGLNDIELGLRLRYEVRRSFAPYIGVITTRRFGDTEDLARRTGAERSETAVVAGMRLRL